MGSNPLGTPNKYSRKWNGAWECVGSMQLCRSFKHTSKTRGQSATVDYKLVTNYVWPWDSNAGTKLKRDEVEESRRIDANEQMQTNRCKLVIQEDPFLLVTSSFLVVNQPPFLEPGSPEAQATNGLFQNYQKWSRVHGNYQNRRTSILWLMLLSTKIDSAGGQMFGAGHKCRRLPQSRWRCRRK